MSLTLEIKGLDKLKEQFAKAPQIVLQEINPAIQKSIILLHRLAGQKVPVDLGFLGGAEAMKTELSNLRGTLKNTAKYAKAVHDGTRPHWIPIDAITPWANRHGIPPFLVARSIARKGTKAHPFFSDAIRDGQREIDSLFEKALNNIANKLAK